MRRTWVLDTETKGTGAQVVPLDKAVEKPAPKRRRRGRPSPPAPTRGPERKPPVTAEAGPLPAGHVRKKATGEIGRVQSVDAKAGTATVLWLRQGRTSTVRLTAITRR